VEGGSEEEGADGSIGDFFGRFVGALGSGEGVGYYQAA
jgi:hypothetical protein